MTNCTHSFCSDVPPRIFCRKCGIQASCDKMTHKSIFGFSKYKRKTHRFYKRICVECGMYQFKIAKYIEVKA